MFLSDRVWSQIYAQFDRGEIVAIGEAVTRRIDYPTGAEVNVDQLPQPLATKLVEAIHDVGRARRQRA